jgi:hypothetical protein
MKIKTTELTGTALDWAVAHALGKATAWMTDHKHGYVNSASTDWSQGGPIIEREKLSISAWGTDQYRAQSYWNEGYNTFVHVPMFEQYGPTPLIAAMRCFVISRLGDEVSLEELL